MAVYRVLLWSGFSRRVLAYGVELARKELCNGKGLARLMSRKLRNDLVIPAVATVESCSRGSAMVWV